MTDTSYVIAPAAPSVLPIKGSNQLFPIRRIYCVGRNYADHALEMGGDPSREPPFFFQKNPDNILPEGQDFPYPSQTDDVHFEVEMVIALGKGGSNISQADALDHVFGYAIGLDMTRRDLQAEAKEQRRPWEAAKAFEKSAPCGEIVPVDQSGHISSSAIHLDVNGQSRQSGNVNQMIWKTPEIIAYLSNLFILAPGDLIFTGTPAGVGSVQRGDVMVAQLENVGDLKVTVV